MSLKSLSINGDLKKIIWGPLALRKHWKAVIFVATKQSAVMLHINLIGQKFCWKIQEYRFSSNVSKIALFGAIFTSEMVVTNYWKESWILPTSRQIRYENADENVTYTVRKLFLKLMFACYNLWLYEKKVSFRLLNFREALKIIYCDNFQATFDTRGKNWFLFKKSKYIKIFLKIFYLRRYDWSSLYW